MSDNMAMAYNIYKMSVNIDPKIRHLIVATVGTVILYLAIHFAPLWAVLAIAFAVLYLVDSNNNFTKGI